MSEKPKVIVYSSDREWIRSNEEVMRGMGDYPMYVLTTWNYGPGSALWNIEGDLVLVYQDLSHTLGHRTGLDGRHLLHGYIDLFLTGPEALMDILASRGYTYDYSWLTYETAAPPIRKKGTS